MDKKCRDLGQATISQQCPPIHEVIFIRHRPGQECGDLSQATNSQQCPPIHGVVWMRQRPGQEMWGFWGRQQNTNSLHHQSARVTRPFGDEGYGQRTWEGHFSLKADQRERQNFSVHDHLSACIYSLLGFYAMPSQTEI